MEKPSLAVVDLGFLYTQAVVNKRQVIMKSVAGLAKELQFGNLDFNVGRLDKDFIVSWLGDKKYFVSDLAIDQSEAVFHSLKDDRFDNETIKLLARTAFGIGFGGGFNETYVVSGLPISHFKKYKDSIAKLFMGSGQQTHTYDVTYKRAGAIEQRVQGSARTLDGRFVPQPFMALMDKVLDDKGEVANKELSTSRVLTIDPGFGTTDMFYTDSLSPVEKYMFSTETAMNHAYKLIGQKIHEQFDLELPLYKVERIARAQELTHKGKNFKLDKVVDWAYKATSDQLLSEVHNRVDMKEVDYVILGGGGGVALAPHINKHLENVMQGDQWSVANGGYKFGVMTWKDSL